MRRPSAIATAQILLAVALLASLSACRKAETALEPEANPPGDIPASEVYASYRSPDGGYSLDAPERWTRTERGSAVSFKDGPDGIAVAVQAASAPPTVASAREGEAKSLEKSGRATEIVSVEDVTLPAGPAVVIRYRTNSDPDAAGKQRRVENRTILFYAPGKLAGLTMWSPQGTHNGAHWDRVATSFRWTP